MDLLEGAIHVCRQLRLAGFQGYFAGGCVRDRLLDRTPKDYDIATDARPDQVKVLFDRTVLVGEQFGVVRAAVGGHEYEIATFRSDGTYTDGRRPDAVVFSSLEEDVRRRDFTINAMMYDPIDKRIVDLVGGQRDLDAGIIQAVGDPAERFAEDKLRMLRAVRFACQLPTFEIAVGTRHAITQAAAGITDVSEERITEELSKMWRSDPGEGWRQLHNLGLLPHVMPYAATEWRRAGAMDRLTEDGKRLPPEQMEAVAWAITLHQVPIGDVDDEMREHLRLSNAMMRRINDLLLAREDVTTSATADSARGIRILLRPDAGMFMVYQSCLIGWPDHPVTAAFQRAIDLLRDHPLPLDQIPRGNDMLHLFQGQQLGRALRAAEEAILERRARTKGEAIAIATKEIDGGGAT